MIASAAAPHTISATKAGRAPRVTAPNSITNAKAAITSSAGPWRSQPLSSVSRLASRVVAPTVIWMTVPAVAATSAATPAVSVQATGGPAIFKDFDRVNERDLRVSEGVQLPLVLLILLLVLGSLIAAGLPVLATVVALTVTLGGL